MERGEKWFCRRSDIVTGSAADFHPAAGIGRSAGGATGGGECGRRGVGGDGDPDGHFAGGAVGPDVVGDGEEGFVGVFGFDDGDAAEEVGAGGGGELGVKGEDQGAGFAVVVDGFGTVDQGAAFDGGAAFVGVYAFVGDHAVNGHGHGEGDGVVGVPVAGDGGVAFVGGGRDGLAIEGEGELGGGFVSVGVEVAGEGVALGPGGDADSEGEILVGLFGGDREVDVAVVGVRGALGDFDVGVGGLKGRFAGDE